MNVGRRPVRIRRGPVIYTEPVSADHITAASRELIERPSSRGTGNASPHRSFLQRARSEQYHPIFQLGEPLKQIIERLDRGCEDGDVYERFDAGAYQRIALCGQGINLSVSLLRTFGGQE